MIVGLTAEVIGAPVDGIALASSARGEVMTGVGFGGIVTISLGFCCRSGSFFFPWAKARSNLSSLSFLSLSCSLCSGVRLATLCASLLRELESKVKNQKVKIGALDSKKVFFSMGMIISDRN